LIFVADDCIYDPIVRALQIIRFEVKRRTDIGTRSPDPPILEACLHDHNILITFDMGIPPQAYLYDFGQNGLTIVLLRWKTSTYKDWQQIVEIILRDSSKWKESAQKEAGIISVNYKKGSRIRLWKDIPPIISSQVNSS